MFRCGEWRKDSESRTSRIKASSRKATDQIHLPDFKISKPLWSVGKFCDVGCKVEFGKSVAKIIEESTGKQIGTFPRSQGLYIGKLELKNPGASQSFPRQA